MFPVRGLGSQLGREKALSFWILYVVLTIKENHPSWDTDDLGFKILTGISPTLVSFPLPGNSS